MSSDPTTREYWDKLIAWTQTARFSGRVRALNAMLAAGEPIAFDQAAEFLGLPLDVFADSLAEHLSRQRGDQAAVH